MTSSQDLGPNEPLFEKFRELQPDVEVVVLPPAPVVDALLVGPADLDRVAEEALEQVEATLAPVLNTPARASGWRPAPQRLQEHVSDWTQTYARDGDALNALLLLRDMVLEAGWAAEPVPAPTPRMTAKAPSGLIRLDAVAEARTVRVQALGPLVRVQGES